MALVAHYRFSLDDLDRLRTLGVLPDRREVELLEGEIVVPPARGARHAAALRTLLHHVAPALGGASISIRDPLRLGDSELCPDLMLLRPRADRYAAAHPGVADVLLVVEVAEESLAYDRLVKIPLYGHVGIGEAWVLDVEARRLWVHRRSAEGGFDAPLTLDGEDAVGVEVLPSLRVTVSSLFRHEG